MKITLLSDDAIRLEPTPGPLTIEAPSTDVQYSPFQMLASGLASCTFSLIYSWAVHANHSVDDLAIEVHWSFADAPHRMSEIQVVLDWPSLPANRIAAAKRASELCTIHATLSHSPNISVTTSSESAAHEHHHAKATA